MGEFFSRYCKQQLVRREREGTFCLNLECFHMLWVYGLFYGVSEFVIILLGSFGITLFSCTYFVKSNFT